MKSKIKQQNLQPTPVASQQQTAPATGEHDTVNSAAVEAVSHLTVAALRRCQNIIESQIYQLQKLATAESCDEAVSRYLLTAIRGELADALLLEEILDYWQDNNGDDEATNLIGSIQSATGLEFSRPAATSQPEKSAA